MKSAAPGPSTSPAEVTNVSPHKESDGGMKISSGSSTRPCRLSGNAVSKMSPELRSNAERISEDERERGSIGNRLRVKPLCPEVAHHHQLRNTRLQGSTPAASKSPIYLCVNNLIGRLAGSRRVHHKTAHRLGVCLPVTRTRRHTR